MPECQQNLEKTLASVSAVVSQESDARVSIDERVQHLKTSVEQREQMLIEARDQITNLRRADANLDNAAAQSMRVVNERLTALERRVPPR